MHIECNHQLPPSPPPETSTKNSMHASKNMLMRNMRGPTWPVPYIGVNHSFSNLNATIHSHRLRRGGGGLSDQAIVYREFHIPHHNTLTLGGHIIPNHTVPPGWGLKIPVYHCSICTPYRVTSQSFLVVWEVQEKLITAHNSFART